MSEYYLADQKAEERALQRELEKKPAATAKPKQEMKVKLLGDFLFPTEEPKGCDPYNTAQGKPSSEPWKTRHKRR